MVTCAVPGCNSSKNENTQNFTFHIFPQNIGDRQKWLKMINRKNWIPKKYSKLCSKHFEQKCFSHRGTQRVKLRSGSIPTLFMPLPNDMENYIKYQVMGSVGQVRMRAGCVPTKFECQKNPSKSQNKNRKSMIQEPSTTTVTNVEESEQIASVEHNVADEKTPKFKCRSYLTISPNINKGKCIIQVPKTTRLNYVEESEKNKETVFIEQSDETGISQEHAMSPEPLTCIGPPQAVRETPIDELEVGTIIYRIYKYLLKEYEYLKTLDTGECDLSFLGDVAKRVSDATGVNQHTITTIVLVKELNEDFPIVMSTPDHNELNNKRRIHTLEKKSQGTTNTLENKQMNKKSLGTSNTLLNKQMKKKSQDVINTSENEQLNNKSQGTLSISKHQYLDQHSLDTVALEHNYHKIDKTETKSIKTRKKRKFLLTTRKGRTRPVTSSSAMNRNRKIVEDKAVGAKSVKLIKKRIGKKRPVTRKKKVTFKQPDVDTNVKSQSTSDAERTDSADEEFHHMDWETSDYCIPRGDAHESREDIDIVSGIKEEFNSNDSEDYTIETKYHSPKLFSTEVDNIDGNNIDYEDMIHSQLVLKCEVDEEVVS